MELKFTVDTDEMFDEEGFPEVDFNTLLTDGLQKEVIKEAQRRVKTDKFNEFAERTIEKIEADIKHRMENFLSEEIVLTDKWGRADFIGSIDDLIKSRFDNVILRPVNNAGKTLDGCSAEAPTWIEWVIKKKLDNLKENMVKRASDAIERSVKTAIMDEIKRLQDSAIRDQVAATFGDILKK